MAGHIFGCLVVLLHVVATKRFSASFTLKTALYILLISNDAHIENDCLYSDTMQMNANHQIVQNVKSKKVG